MTAARQSARQRIGPYRLLVKIGEGGMGIVHLAKLDGPPGVNKLAVVKELRAELAGSREFVELFLNEARLATRLTHPNVVHTYGANEESGRLYIAMEYLDGQPWSRVRHVLLANRSLPPAIYLKVLADVLAGLHYAHELRDYDGSPLRVVHRDVSPQNVFVTYDGHVKVVDFGVARAVIGTERACNAVVVGKLSYVAPEQLRGEQVDQRADIFSVGVMLWEALTGRRFAERQSRAESMQRRLAGAEPSARTVALNVPRELSDICERALALSPRDRFSSAQEFRDAILGYLARATLEVDVSQLGRLISNAFKEERVLIHSVIDSHLKPTSPPSTRALDELIAGRERESVEHTLRADLSELATVSRLQDDKALLEASSSASVRFRFDRYPALGAAVAAVFAVALLVWVAFTSGRKSPLPVAGATSPPTALVAAAPRVMPASVPAVEDEQRALVFDRDQSIKLGLAHPARASEHRSHHHHGEDQAPASVSQAEPSSGRASEPEAEAEARPEAVTRAELEREAQAESTAETKLVSDGQDPGVRDHAPGEVGFGARITVSAKTRPIYEEAPY